MRKVQNLIRFFGERKEQLSPLLILTHDYPDPDALASAVALQYLAEKGFGIKSRVTFGGVIGRSENREMVKALKLRAYKLRPSDFKKSAGIALVDTQPLFKNNSFPKKRKATIVIDQHPYETKPTADLVIVDPEIGATSVILAECLLTMNLEIPPRVATALVYGILSDTLNLFRAHKPEIINTYLKLLPLCDIRALARIQNPRHSRRFFVTVVRAIQRASIRRRLIISHLGQVENPDLVSQMADFFLACEGIEWTFCSGRYGEHLHVSLRIANPEGSAGELLRDLFSDRGQAGGHGHIAGGRIKVGANVDAVEWERIEEQLSSRLSEKLSIPTESVFHTSFFEQPQGA
jgi:nanoRNase/pAp phosphatase (c-di-AMP/oligoRNAs hydrolase)